MPRRLRLIDEVRPGQRLTQGDLAQVRSTLSRIGLFDPAQEQTMSESLMTPGLRRAVRTFQAGQGLREDAILRPRGPTEERLNLLLEQNRTLRSADNGAGLETRERTPGALVSRVGPGLENHPDDVSAVGAVLRQLGHIKPGARNPPSTGAVFDGLKSFQRQNGLATDRIIAPDGPTERGLAEALLAGFRQDPATRAQLAELEQLIVSDPRRRPDPEGQTQGQGRPRPTSISDPVSGPERGPTAIRVPLLPFPEELQPEVSRIPPVPRRKPFAGPPVPRRKPQAPQPDPNLGGIEPEFDLLGGLLGIPSGPGATEVAGSTVEFFAKGSPLVSMLRTLGLPGLLVGFMLGAFGNNTEPGFGQNPIGS